MRAMLDFMRQHAEGWGIKILLGVISLSFALFFGYSAYTNRDLGGQVAAVIGEKEISMTQYNQAYQASIQRIQDQFSEGIPADFTKFLRSNVLQQLIQRQVQVDFVDQLGFTISDQEVASTIKKQKQFYRDGIFDINYYKKQFLPFYRDQYGIDFETALRQDLVLDQYNAFKAQSFLPPLEEENWEKQRNKETWNFEVVKVNRSKAKELLKDAEDLDKAITTQLNTWLATWNNKPLSKAELNKLAGTTNSVTVSLLNRRKLLNRQLPEEHALALFKLREKGVVYPQPIKLGNDWFLLKLNKYEVLTKTDQPATSRSSVGINNEFFTAWIDEFRKNTPIKANIEL